MRFVDGSTNQKIQRTCSREISLFDQLRPGFLGKIGDDAFLHARLHFHVLRETVHDLRLVKQGAIQGGAGVWRLPEPWCARRPARFLTEQKVAESGPVAWFQRLGSFARMGAFSPQTLRIRRLVSTLKPLRIVIHSLTCSTRVAVCGTRFTPKNHALWKWRTLGFYTSPNPF